MLNIALVCKYVAHMGHWPSGFSKINLQTYSIMYWSAYIFTWRHIWSYKRYLERIYDLNVTMQH